MTNSGSSKKDISLNYIVGYLGVVSGLAGLTQLKLSKMDFILSTSTSLEYSCLMVT